MNSEKGQTFPLALIALAVGSLVISPFLGHASSMLTGSRIYGQAISEQYSCDAGIEWALWKLKGNPLELTDNTSYDAAPLGTTPSGINGPSFPTTEIRFVEDGEHSKEETVEWVTEPGWNEHLLDMPGPGTLDLMIETEAPFVKVKLLGDKPKEYNLFFPPFELELQIGSAGIYIIQVETPGYTGLVTMTITTTYPAAIYDIRAQKDNTIITARAEASNLRVGVRSWQVE